jgi:hypothetical protein
VRTPCRSTDDDVSIVAERVQRALSLSASRQLQSAVLARAAVRHVTHQSPVSRRGERLADYSLLPTRHERLAGLLVTSGS